MTGLLICPLQVTCVALYMAIYIVHMVHTFKELRARPYSRSKLSNMLFRIQVGLERFAVRTLGMGGGGGRDAASPSPCCSSTGG